MMLPCGHTFCLVCISQTLVTEKEFNCLNCFLRIQDQSKLRMNLILCDKQSYRKLGTPSRNRSTKVKNEFLDRQNVSMARLDQERNSSRKRTAQVEMEYFQDSLVFDKPFHSNQKISRQCKGADCIQPCDDEFCSAMCFKSVHGSRTEVKPRVQPQSDHIFGMKSSITGLQSKAFG